MCTMRWAWVHAVCLFGPPLLTSSALSLPADLLVIFLFAENSIEAEDWKSSDGAVSGAARNCALFSSVSLVTVTSHHIMGSALNWGFYCRHLLPNSRRHRMMYQFLTLSGARYFFMSLVRNLKAWVLEFIFCVQEILLWKLFSSF